MTQITWAGPVARTPSFSTSARGPGSRLGGVKGSGGWRVKGWVRYAPTIWPGSARFSQAGPGAVLKRQARVGRIWHGRELVQAAGWAQS